jgi:hypothetical protein
MKHPPHMVGSHEHFLSISFRQHNTIDWGLGKTLTTRYINQVLSKFYTEFHSVVLKLVGKECNSLKKRLIVHIKRGCIQQHAITLLHVAAYYCNNPWEYTP